MSIADKLSQIEKQIKAEGPKQKAAAVKPRAPKQPASSKPAAPAQPADAGESAGTGKAIKRDRGGIFKGSTSSFQPKSSEPAPGLLSESRAAPVGKIVKDVLECLRNNRGWMTADEIQASTKHDVHSPLVLQHLTSSERCLQEGGQFKYLPRHVNIVSRQALLDHIRYHKAGTFIMDVDDSYPEIMHDIDALKSERRIVAIEHPERKDAAIFWCDMMSVSVAPELVTFFHSSPADLPEELQELQLKVEQAGLRSHIAALPLRRPAGAVAPRERKRKVRAQRLNLEKATNKHLPEMLIKHQNAGSIDKLGS